MIFMTIIKTITKITKDPSFVGVAMFSMTFLIAGVLLPMTSALDGGQYCNHFNTEEKRSSCTKLNAIILVLAISVPTILGLLTYYFAKIKCGVSANCYNKLNTSTL